MYLYKINQITYIKHKNAENINLNFSKRLHHLLAMLHIHSKGAAKFSECIAIWWCWWRPQRRRRRSDDEEKKKIGMESNRIDLQTKNVKYCDTFCIGWKLQRRPRFQMVVIVVCTTTHTYRTTHIVWTTEKSASKSIYLESDLNFRLKTNTRNDRTR